MKNDPKSVKSLLAAGADPNFALPDGTKVLIVAASHIEVRFAAGAWWMAAPIRTWPIAAGILLSHCRARAVISIRQKLLAKGANANAKPKSAGGGRGGGGGGFRFVAGEQTPLMLAARANYVEVVRA